MALKTVKLAALGCVLSGMAWAECRPPAFTAAVPPSVPVAPTPPDPGLRPEIPACLAVIDRPEQENCPRDVLAAYADAVDAWAAALNAYVAATERFANDAVEAANAAIDHARAATRHADAAVAFANCEAERINALAR